MEKVIQTFLILALVFIAICLPILSFLALADGAEVSFALSVITLIELAILLIVFMMDKLLA